MYTVKVQNMPWEVPLKNQMD